jgi:hypothetical protein
VISSSYQNFSQSDSWNDSTSSERYCQGMRSFFPKILRRLEATYPTASHFHMSRSRRWRKNSAARKAARAHLHSSSTSKMDDKSVERTDYSVWSHENLIQRVTQLENELKAQNRRSLYLPLLNLKIRMLTEVQFDPCSYSRKEILEEATQ